MSVAGLDPRPAKLFEKTFRHSNDSGELDVFEASRYFAGEPAAGVATFTHNSSDYWNRVTAAGGGGGVRRISLDMPSMRNHHRQSLFSSSQHHHHTAADQKQTLKDKKHKQPSSPGGRIASFLNSLFTQSAAKKKKPKPAAATHDPDDGRRKRRSSISLFPTNPNHTTAVPSKSAGLCPPPATLSITPTKTAFRTISDHKETQQQKNPDPSEPEKPKNLVGNKFRHWDRSKLVFNDEDGAESDSSSDLFELPNYDLCDYSNELPVYETTHVDSVKRGAPISVHRP